MTSNTPKRTNQNPHELKDHLLERHCSAERDRLYDSSRFDLESETRNYTNKVINHIPYRLY